MVYIERHLNRILQKKCLISRYYIINIYPTTNNLDFLWNFLRS